MTLRRPAPLLRHDAQAVDAGLPPDRAAQRLLDGERLVVADHYGTGAEILARLAALLPPAPEGADHALARARQRAFREVALRLLAPIREHRVALAGARPNGFLAELYPELRSFWLPFPQVQELHGAWTRYRDGVHLAVLGHRLHPFYGTYVPTRTAHLELFATWLARHDGPRDRAIDVGTGCGVLALLLARAGFGDVLATDVDPNAVESVRRDLRRLDPPPPVRAHEADLLGHEGPSADLIAFNPPWLQGPVESPLDRALYFEPGLFERFFDQAVPRLGPHGRLVILFSNLIRLVQPGVVHPVSLELERGRLCLVDKLQRRARPSRPGARTRERVELWVLAAASQDPATRIQPSDPHGRAPVPRRR